MNSTESCHAVLRLYREKGTKWAAARCFLGENFGFLNWQRLQLAFWGVTTNPWLEFADMIQTRLGITIPIPPEKVTEWEEQLSEGLKGKYKRLDPNFQKKRAAYRAKVAGYAASATATSAYQSGGTEAALATDLVQGQEHEQARFLGLDEHDRAELAVVDNATTGGLLEQRGSEMVDEDGGSDGGDSDG